MKTSDIRSKSEKELRYRRGRTRNLPRFRKILERYRETGDPLNLDDVVEFMGVSHHSLRNYAKELGLRMIVMTDEEGIRWVAFKAEKQ
jgi:hypothetical protein